MRFEALTDKERARIHDSSLKILEETGLRVPSASMLTGRLREAGLEVGDDGALRIDSGTVDAALRKAPRVVRLGARDPQRTVVLDGSRTFVTTDGCAAKTLDIETGKRRPATLADIAASARLTDALENFDVYWMMVSASDVSNETRVPREYLTAIRNTTKHVQMIDMARPDEARTLVRMAREMLDAGLFEDPPVSALISIVSPLRLDPGGTEAALIFAAAGLPIAVCSMPIASVTSPATPAGTVALAHAEILGFATSIQTLHPGAPIIYTSYPSFADARTGQGSYSDRRRLWAAAAAVQLGRAVGVPCFTTGGITDVLAGTDLISGGGLLETSTLLAFDQLVIDDEAMRDLFMATEEQPVDSENLALDLIRSVGPGGHFLAQKHSARHIREYPTHRYTGADRPIEPDTPGAAQSDPLAAAGAEVRRILSEHVVPALPEDLEKRLEGLVAGQSAPSAVSSRR